jgi:hypothetical protein
MAELRISVPLTREEFIALKKRASAELRQPRDQARYMLRVALLHDPPDQLRNESKEAPKFAETGGASFFTQS